MSMTEAVIVSTARTPIGKAQRGAFNITHGADLGGHAIRAAMERAGVDPASVEARRRCAPASRRLRRR
jgi:acetyl-CoA C-acetyltransferase